MAAEPPSVETRPLDLGAAERQESQPDRAERQESQPDRALSGAGTDVGTGRRLRVVAAEPGRGRFDSIVEQVLAEPARTPEIVALALVRVFGPGARDWTEGVRATYPRASREALARLAVERFARAAGLRGGVGALAGPYAPVALGAATVITHAELVLHLAAIHGLDPTDPQRAVDLLRLVSPGSGTVAGWAVLALAGPGVRLLTAVLSARTSTEAIAVRARRYYTESQLSQESGSSW